MNTATTTTENPPVEDEAQIKAEIRRLKEEIEADLAAMAESQRRIEVLRVSTQARLDRIKKHIRTYYPEARVFS